MTPPTNYEGKTTFIAESPEAQVAEMKAGVNIVSGYNPFWEDKPTTFKPVHVTKVAEAGFSTVRVPIFTFGHLMPDGHLDPRWLAKLDSIVSLAEQNHLTIIIDEHDFIDCEKDTDACIVKLRYVWHDLAEHYKNAPASIAFELLNEPNGAINSLWNKWLVELLTIVRKSNPERNVIIGPVWWNGLGFLPRLKLPAKDRHIILTYHYYEPLAFTHQGAKWAGPDIAKLHDVRWRGSQAEIAAINRDFDKVSAWAKAHHRPVFLGEYGTYQVFGKLEDRVRWTKTVSDAADARGFARAYWDFDGGFATYDSGKDEWITPIRDALVPSKVLH